MFQHIEVTWRILVYMIALVVQQKDFPHNLNVQDILHFFKLAVENSKPILEVKSRRVGGSNYQVPIEVPNRRQFYLAAQWIIDSAKKRSGSSMSNRLAGELISASNNEGTAIKKKEDTHRMAEANKAFAHFGRGR